MNEGISLKWGWEWMQKAQRDWFAKFGSRIHKISWKSNGGREHENKTVIFVKYLDINVEFIRKPKSYQFFERDAFKSSTERNL